MLEYQLTILNILICIHSGIGCLDEHEIAMFSVWEIGNCGTHSNLCFTFSILMRNDLNFYSQFCRMSLNFVKLICYL